MQNFMEIQDGHFQLCQKVADLAWNDSNYTVINAHGNIGRGGMYSICPITNWGVSFKERGKIAWNGWVPVYHHGCLVIKP
jgi:hypothetical protein